MRSKIIIGYPERTGSMNLEYINENELSSNEITDGIILKLRNFMSIFISFCDIVIECRYTDINNNILHSKTFKLYRKVYSQFTVSKRKPDVVVTFLDNSWKTFNTQEEHYVKFYEETKNGINTYYSISIPQFEIILAEIIKTFLDKKGIIPIHGSASLINGKAHLFLGPSGAGKSTVSHLIQKRYQKLSDDHFFIVRKNKKFYLAQSPLTEKIKLKRTYKLFPVGNILILQKAKVNNISRIYDNELAEFVIKQLLYTEKLLDFQMNMVTELSKTIHGYVFRFNKNKNSLLRFFQNSEDF